VLRNAETFLTAAFRHIVRDASVHMITVAGGKHPQPESRFSYG
jgi:hypothetical protein